MKKWLYLLIIVILVMTMVLTACGQSQPAKDTVGSTTGDQQKQDEQKQDESKENVGSEKAELRIFWWGSQDRHDRTIKVIEMFEEKNPDVSIQYEFSGWDGYWEKVAALAAANNLPDVFQQDYQYLAQYAKKGLLEALDPYVERGILDLSDVDESSIVGGKVDGKLYGINLGSNAPCIVYDPALFEQAGVPEPTPDWTWEDYMNAAKTIHEKLDIYADRTFPGGYFHGLKHYVRQHGQKLYSDDGTKLDYSDDKLFEEFFTMELELVKQGALPMPDERLEVKSVEDEFLVTKKAAMAAVHSNQIVAMTKAANRPLKLALLPKHKDQVKEGMYVKPSMFFAVAATSKNKDKAVQFVNYFTNDIEANKVLLAERGVPISSKVREALMPLLNDAQKEMFNFMEVVISNSSPIDPPDPPGHPEVDKLLKNLEEQILYGQLTPAEAAIKFREEANKILAKSAQQ
ncbi:extracellular solute-binding protein [Caldicoprobacter algeriensis]|uniref:ABC transporter substrate-binding protein n=1 Tax=Caldicoprobacter algeriensis TaxID=699281 RepID=UPI002079D7C3|nr:extracellular solute-binding protein [Caldicoprobacter algeriensis]MCM8900211.1 extracellular solute-binding protein [Caldicoprobacter algeriensis]